MKKSKISDYYISDEIIASVVINAARKNDGIYCFEKKPFKFKYLFHNGENLKYVEVYEYDDCFDFTLYLNVKNGFSIPGIVYSVKDKVKTSVEKVTDKTVRNVNINIVSIHFDD